MNSDYESPDWKMCLYCRAIAEVEGPGLAQHLTPNGKDFCRGDKIAPPSPDQPLPAGRFVGEGEGPLHPVRGVIAIGPVLILCDWVLAKLFLHGQMGWLWWAPSLLVVVSGITSQRNRDRGCIVGLLTLALALVVGPVAIKLQQALFHERAFYAATQPLLDRKLISGGVGEDRSTVVAAGWEVCDGLDAVRDHRDDFLSGRSVYEITASFAAFGDAKGFTDNRLEADWTSFVRLADQHLC